MKKILQPRFIVKEFRSRDFLRNRINSKTKLPRQNSRKFVPSYDRKRIVIEGQSGSISIESLCLREGISVEEFSDWSDDLLSKNATPLGPETIATPLFSDVQKYNIVIEGKSGKTTIPEICKRENISQGTFLLWCNEFLQYRNKRLSRESRRDAHTIKIKSLIEEKSNEHVLNYVESYIDVTRKNTYVCPDINSHSNLSSAGTDIKNVLCLEKINHLQFINRHFIMVNSRLAKNGIFIGCLETFQARKNRLRISKIPALNNFYFLFEFLLSTVFRRLFFTKKHNFDFTKGGYRFLSKAEGLGRLVSCGFKIMDYKSIDGLVYFVVKKEREPDFNLYPNYGPVCAMPRLGQNGKIFKVYKFRTMHPFSEHLQDYVLKVNGYAETGKPAGDFRIPTWGKFMRRFWIDEIPQLINVFKGEMKLVGIRPVSERYFQDIPREMQKLRQTQKPGCIPPYLSLNRNPDMFSVLQAEKDYLEEKIKSPYFTDTKYLFNAIFNIIFNHRRSA